MFAVLNQTNSCNNQHLQAGGTFKRSALQGMLNVVTQPTTSKASGVNYAIWSEPSVPLPRQKRVTIELNKSLDRMYDYGISRSSGRVTVESTVSNPAFKPCKPVRVHLSSPATLGAVSCSSVLLLRDAV